LKSTFRIIMMAKKYWGLLLASFIAMGVQTAASLYSPMVLKNFIALFEGDLSRFSYIAPRLAVTLLVLYLLSALGQFFRSYLTHLAAWSFVHDTRIKLFDHIQRLSLKFFHDKQTGQLLSRISSDTAVLEVLIAHAVPESVVNVITLIGITAILLKMNVTLGLITLISLPPTLILVYQFAKRVRPQFKGAHQKTAELYAVLQDDISGIKEIQIFNKQDCELERVRAKSNEHLIRIISALKKSAVYHPAIGFCNQLGMVLVVLAGGTIASRGGISVSEITAFMLYLNMFYQPINTLGRLSEDFQNAGTAAERILEMLSEKSDVEDMPDAEDMPRVRGRVEYKNVSFEYVRGQRVIDNFSLTINPGEKVAFVGSTGVGKTTLASLVARFYDPSSGEILIDGINIKTVTQKSLRENMSIVLQDVFLFNGSIAENIAYGVPGASREAIINAAKAANAHEFILKTENGYDTMIGERGMRLSGGQKQRLSIARAVLKNAPVLILDEATASVDNETEKQIHEAINKLTQNCTTIIIAHRLSTVKNADKIVVLGNDGIEESGTHEELMDLGGAYMSLYKANGEGKALE
jgi:ATP-binding cassette subfamily B protein